MAYEDELDTEENTEAPRLAPGDPMEDVAKMFANFRSSARDAQDEFLAVASQARERAEKHRHSAEIEDQKAAVNENAAKTLDVLIKTTSEMLSRNDKEEIPTRETRVRRYQPGRDEF